MADIRNWPAFIRGRWDWHRLGYETGLPRGCGFGDLDANLELSGHHLVIECKAWDGLGEPPGLSTGQLIALRSLAKNGTTAWVLYGCAGCNNPLYVRSIRSGETDGVADFRELPLLERRQEFKTLIDNWVRWANR